jgi:hypothetical protein
MDSPNRNRRITLRKVRRGDEEARADAEFWMSMTGEERVELLWEMVLDQLGISAGADGSTDHDQPRLSRSVRRVRRS